MTFKQRALRALATCAIAGLVAGCGGGGGGSALPGAPGAPGNHTPAMTQHMTAFIPASAVQSQGSRGAKYVSGQGTSSLVVSVVPTDPAEAAQWATIYGASGFTVCYNIFTAGAVASPLAPGVTVTPVVGPPAGFSVNFPFPSPPGQDTFTITQYSGACSATNMYAPPTPAPGQTAASQIISQSPPLVVNLTAGVTNNFNVQLSACNTPPGGGPISQPAPVTCAVPNPPGTTTITPTLGASVSYVYLAQSAPALPITLPAAIPLPIAGPMREQTIFTAAANNVGFPLPVVGLDASGNAIPYTAPVLPNTTPSSGLLPKATDSIVITASEVDASGTNHFALKLVDATTGAVAQTSATGGAGITLHSVNGLACTAFPADCAGGGANGDPYVVMATFDGSSAAASTSVTVTLNATLNGTAMTAQTLTIKPQASLFTAVAAGPGPGYTDTAAPYTTAADILNTTGATGVAVGGQGYWVSDGGSLHKVGGATSAVAGATTLTGLTLDNDANIGPGQIMAADNSVTGAATGTAGAPVNSGIFVMDPATPATNKPLAVQYGSTNVWYQAVKPQAIAFVGTGSTHYVYVATVNNIVAVLPLGTGTVISTTGAGGAWYAAQYMGALNITGLNFGSVTGFDMIASGTKLIFADTGNNRIVSIDTATCVPGGAACTPTVIASGKPFVGLSVNGTGYVATDTAGQIYTITSAGVVTSLGLSNAAAPKDGVVGVIGVSPLAPAPYTTQGQTANFFGSASVPTIPYNIAPFAAAGPVFAGAAQAAVAAGTLKLAPDTSNATFGATAGNTTSGFGIAFITAAGANTALTSNSYLFTDNGALRTLVP